MPTKKTLSFFGVNDHFDTKSNSPEPPLYGTHGSEANLENQQKPERKVVSDQLDYCHKGVSLSYNKLR
jgi:hypothetical protein